MPDKRTHRGPHPEDHELFARPVWPKLAHAVHDLSWLLSQGYADASSLKLVGDRHGLTQRQRMAVMRCACSDAALAERTHKMMPLSQLAGRTLWLDGYNVLTTLESALAQGVVLAARDGCFRDVASMHGTYRKVQETQPAINLMGDQLMKAKIGRCQWYLDRPVSNSARLKKIILDIAAQQGWNWTVELVPDPDRVLMASDDVVASSDSEILNRCRNWCNLAREIISTCIPNAYVVELTPASKRQSS